MAYPHATLLRLQKYGLEPVALEDTDHFRLLREFFQSLRRLLETMAAWENVSP
ncbi:MAG TPA: hypothetical protein VN154_13325 [Rhizomicrobium sp.]|nr:hypothetical protein [Rhizomicrobium sp.]